MHRMSTFRVPAFGLEWAQELEEAIVEELSRPHRRISGMEIIPENFFDGRFESFLDLLGKTGVPVAVHGVLLSLGSMEPLREDHLDRVLEIARRVNMVNLSEHLSLTSIEDIDLDALTPLAWTEEVLDVVTSKIRRIQSRLEVPFLIENVSNRFIVPDSDYSETSFINRVIDRTGCGLLLDVTNVYTNSVNFGFDPYRWIDEINLDAVHVIHLAGGAPDPDGFLLDSHDHAVAGEAWDLYRHTIGKTPPCLTIIERTGRFPRFGDLLLELETAERLCRGESSELLRPEQAAESGTTTGGGRG